MTTASSPVTTALWQRSAVELAATIKCGEASSRQVVQAHLDRIDAVNDGLN
ncbi:MAG: hypothetical protein HKN03_01320 [Acidimicrobiales bacterium]|nr:hypothetical protein [Acidimicrobiales bacterium]